VDAVASHAAHAHAHPAAHADANALAMNSGENRAETPLEARAENKGDQPVDEPASAASQGAPSIHDLEHAHTLESLPPADLGVRCLVQLRAIADHVTPAQYELAAYAPLRSWTNANLSVVVREHTADHVSLECTGEDLSLTITVFQTGALTFVADWSEAVLPEPSVMAIEVSLGARASVDVECAAAEQMHRYDIVSRAKSERGLETTVQGKAVVCRVPASAHHAVLQMRPG